MNKTLMKFLHRGLIFSGFGPIIVGIVYLFLEMLVDDITLNGYDVFTGIVSVYLLAFVHAGTSVFNQIESWSAPKGLLCQLTVLYFSYLICYLINSWLPFDITVVIIFTAIFVVAYLLIWLIVYLIVKQTSKKLNAKL